MKQTGGCHCGKVRFEVEMKLENALSCNCSICLKNGALLDFIPETKFNLLSGESDLAEYKFNKHVIRHLFCKTCGIQAFSRGVAPDGSKVVAINLRSIDDVDLDKLKIQKYDGRSV